MAKLTKMVSAIGSLKELDFAHAEFDDASRAIPAATAYPSADIRPTADDSGALILRVTNPKIIYQAAPQSTGQEDTFAVIHVPAAGEFAGVLVFNTSAQVDKNDLTGKDFPDFLRYLVSLGY